MTDEQEKATKLREIGGIPCEGVLQEPMPSGRRKVTVYGVENEDSWRIAEFVCGKLDWQSQLSAKDATIAAQAADLLDAAMLIRRLAHRCPGLAVAHQATDWLKRKGLQGSILRETEDSNG